MAIVFNKVLIPVDFSLNTEIAVKKATALVGTDRAVLHLLHVVRSTHEPGKCEAIKELERWEQRIREDHPGIEVQKHVLKGRSVQRVIIRYANWISPDLILIGRQNDRRQWASFRNIRQPFFKGVSPDALARRTNCPVLTVKPGSADSRTRIIVIPIRDSLPIRKLEWGVLLARKYRAQVHLLAIQEHKHEEGMPQIFLKAYHHLRENLHHPIEFSATMRHDPVTAALNYAKLIMADMILVNAGSESGVGGLTGSRHISDLLERDSKIQVLDLLPYKTI